MSELVILGFPASTYVWTARLACAEKGVAYRLEPVRVSQLQDDADPYVQLHPFKKVPAMRHGGFSLFESSAITRYIDSAFPGPMLQPSDLRMRCRMDQWVSAACDYYYDAIIREIVLPRFVYPMFGRPTDEAAVAAAVPAAARCLGVLDAELAGNARIVGDGITLADLFLVPIIHYCKATPEGGGLMPRFPAVGRWFAAMAERPSFAATLPEPVQA